VLGVRALEAQHREPAIIERVNAHYGYRAIARIRLSQLGALERLGRNIATRKL